MNNIYVNRNSDRCYFTGNFRTLKNKIKSKKIKINKIGYTDGSGHFVKIEKNKKSNKQMFKIFNILNKKYTSVWLNCEFFKAIEVEKDIFAKEFEFRIDN